MDTFVMWFALGLNAVLIGCLVLLARDFLKEKAKNLELEERLKELGK